MTTTINPNLNTIRNPMNPSENPSATPAVTSFTTARDPFQITQNASYLARRLSGELRGGKRANPNVTRAVAVADHLNARPVMTKSCSS